MDYFVTGGAGFIGSWVVDRLVAEEQGHGLRQPQHRQGGVPPAPLRKKGLQVRQGRPPGRRDPAQGDEGPRLRLAHRGQPGHQARDGVDHGRPRAEHARHLQRARVRAQVRHQERRLLFDIDGLRPRQGHPHARGRRPAAADLALRREQARVRGARIGLLGALRHQVLDLPVRERHRPQVHPRHTLRPRPQAEQGPEEARGPRRRQAEEVLPHGRGVRRRDGLRVQAREGPAELLQPRGRGPDHRQAHRRGPRRGDTAQGREDPLHGRRERLEGRCAQVPALHEEDGQARLEGRAHERGGHQGGGAHRGQGAHETGADLDPGGEAVSEVRIVVGTRPQVIKLASLVKAFDKAKIDYGIVHTGQHYDFDMDMVFFQELGLPKPEAHLGVGSGSHAHMTGNMLIKLEDALKGAEMVLVPGDTNSALAGGLAGVKMGIPVAHVEAGLRSRLQFMPEEINRVMLDHMSQLLFAPTKAGEENLLAEGIPRKDVHRPGDCDGRQYRHVAF